MSVDLDGALADDWTRAQKIPLLDERGRDAGPRLPNAEISALLPQQPPFRFIDAVTAVDEARGVIAARYDPAGWPEILAAHFPGRPVWPGVLQIEAVGQAGVVLARRRHGGSAVPVLTEVMGAKFVRPVAPDGDGVAIVARLVDDGLCFLVMGQCLSRGAVCSAVLLRGMFLEE